MKTEAEVQEALEKLKVLVRTAEDEALFAVQLHESWKRTAYDVDLQERMGKSFATQTFNIVRLALRRELFLTLVRIWDTNKQAVRLTAIWETLRNEQCFAALVQERASGLRAEQELLRQELSPARDEVLALIQKYMPGGRSVEVMDRLRSLRHERLAHRQVEAPAEVSKEQATDEQIETLYHDTLDIVSRLLHLVLAHGLDLTNDATGVYRHYARFFWGTARGERTAGHPNYATPR